MNEDIKKYAVVVDNEIVNVILWDGVSDYEVDGTLLDIDGISPEPGVGWVLKSKKWVDPTPPNPINVGL